MMSDLDKIIKDFNERSDALYKNCDDAMFAQELKHASELLLDLKEFRSGRLHRENFIETVLSVAVAFELDELDVAIFLIKRGIKLDDFSYNNDRYNYFKEFFEKHGLLKGAENDGN